MAFLAHVASVAAMETVLSVRGLQKRYKNVQALAGIDLDVAEGEVFGFLGPNGAGKTTFTKCVTGFVRPDAGEVQIAGIDARRSQAQAAQHVGLVPDQYDFYPNLTGRQHLDFYGRLMGIPERQRRNRIDEVLRLVRMEERADSRTKGYSHGMKQRICIAQAILHQPKLIFFDEPTNGLDPQGAYELRQMIRGLAKEGHTVFLNSHLLNEVQETCERVAILARGQILALERVEDLRRRFGEDAQVTLRVHNPSARIRQAVEKVVGPVNMEGTAAYTFHADDPTTGAAVKAAVAAGALVTEVTPAKASLESVFLQLTQEAAA